VNFVEISVVKVVLYMGERKLVSVPIFDMFVKFST
jgi:hypothetical protein